MQDRMGEGGCENEKQEPKPPNASYSTRPNYRSIPKITPDAIGLLEAKDRSPKWY